jgi:hypothetical protein
MRRVYGYKKLNQAGRRYQDGIGAQAKGDAPIVINGKEETVATATAVAEEVIEVKTPAAKAKITEAPVPVMVPETPKVQTLDEDTSDATGPLPEHMTSFMPSVQNNDATADTDPVKVATEEEAADDTE